VRYAELDARFAADPNAPHARVHVGLLHAVARRDWDAATAAVDRWVAALDAGFATGDWEVMRALHVPHATLEARERRSLVSGDRELNIASLRERGATGARPVFKYLYLGMVASGRVTRVELFELDDLDAALARFEELRAARIPT
jgi:hypothetical protein